MEEHLLGAEGEKGLPKEFTEAGPLREVTRRHLQHVHPSDFDTSSAPDWFLPSWRMRRFLRLQVPDVRHL